MSSPEDIKGKGKGKSKPLQQTTEDDPSFLSTVASSASGLLSSIARPSPSFAASGLNAAVSSTSKSSQQQQVPESFSSTTTGPSSFSSSSQWSEVPAAPPSSATYSDFRTQPFDRQLAEGDYTYFTSTTSNPFPTTTATAFTPSYTDGSEVAALLSLPLATSEIYQDDLIARSVNTSHPAVVAFTECEDPVEFLLATPEWSRYTDSVWGELLEVMREVVEEKPGTDRAQRAAERLKMVWGQLRAKL